MKVLIVGYGITGKSVEKFLKNKNIETIVAKEDIINAKQLNKEISDRLLSGLSFIVTSPGVSQDVEILKQARKRKIKILGEFDFGASQLKCDAIAVTGTNGKTTTVSIINHLLQSYDGKVFLGGNIGTPVTEFCEKTSKTDVAVLECSSFQLERVKNFKPHIAAILNITPDHLNRHKTMEKYFSCKYKITQNQTSNDYLILNADDELLIKTPPKTKAKVFYFSTKKKVVGCYVKRGSIYFNDGLKEIKLASLSGVRLVGEHNISNILCATLAVFLQTNCTAFLGNIKTFQGVAHRIEFVKTIEGVSFYNDSKATNIDSTLTALKSFSCGINLILGGSDKGYGFDKLFESLPKNVAHIAVFGETRNKIVLSAKKYNFKNYYICEGLKASTNLCFKLAKHGEIVLLSPACASFDCFSNYEERGVCFKQIVGEIENENARFECSKKT